jgi:transposase
MPAKNFLHSQDKKKLQEALKQEERTEVRERILMFLLLNDGKTHKEISEFIGCSLKTVGHWCVHGDPNNIESLKDRRTTGNNRKVTKEYIDLMLETIEKEPQEYSYEFGRWTAARLAKHLEKETGLSLSGSQVARILTQKKYAYLWGKYSLEDKQDRELRKVFKEKLERYIKITKSEPESLQIWFWDECGFSLRVIRRRTWTKKGKRKKVKGQRRRGRVNVMGALRYSDKKRLCLIVKKGDSGTFYEQIKVFYDALIEEWIAAGNKLEDFKDNAAQIIIILDNASFHKKQDIIDRISAEFPKIKLEYLPPYSPDYNLIELVWHSAKEYIAHREFDNQEQLEKVVNQLLNEGGLIIKWSKKRKNKGDAVNVT